MIIFHRFNILPPDDSYIGFEVFFEHPSPTESETWKAAEHLLSYLPIGSKGVLYDEHDSAIWCGEIADLNTVSGRFINASDNVIP